MTHDEAFLEAIRERPDDDAPRLIYADWLEEHGGRAGTARAEFIRLQCEQASLPEGSPRWYELDARASALRADHEHSWLGPRGELLQFHQFRRGLLEDIDLEAEQFVNYGNELLRVGPIRHVWLRNSRDVIHTLAASPFLDQVASLNLRTNELGLDEIRILCWSPHLTRLTALNLQTNNLGTAAIALLRQAPFFPRLDSLNLSGSSVLGATAIENLVDGPEQIQLKELDLAGNRLGAAGVQALTSARNLYRRLTCLNLRCNGIPAAGARALPYSGGRLERLYLGGNLIRDDGAQALAASAAFSLLAELDLEGAGLGDEGATALAQSPHLRELTALYLSRNHIRPRGAKALANSTALAKLARLELSDNELGDEGAKALADSPHLANLRALHVGGNGLRAWGVRELVLSPYLCNLHRLHLHSNSLGDQGAQVIARWTRLPQLTELNLNNNRIGDLGVTELANSPHLSSLRVLGLSNNAITAKGIAALKESGLQDRLVSLDLSGNEIHEIAGLLPSSDP